MSSLPVRAENMSNSSLLFKDPLDHSLSGFPSCGAFCFKLVFRQVELLLCNSKLPPLLLTMAEVAHKLFAKTHSMVNP